MFQRIYFSAAGRCSRRFYWQFFVLPCVVVGALIGFAMQAFQLGPLAIVGVAIVLAWPSACIYIKRWHDIGLSGWFAILNFVPGLGAVLWLVLGFIPGTTGNNEYGPNPAVPSRSSAL
jgi:uncharacterized membrane protein YhaH (DUF805 family)